MSQYRNVKKSCVCWWINTVKRWCVFVFVHGIRRSGLTCQDFSFVCFLAKKSSSWKRDIHVYLYARSQSQKKCVDIEGLSVEVKSIQEAVPAVSTRIALNWGSARVRSERRRRIPPVGWEAAIDRKEAKVSEITAWIRPCCVLCSNIRSRRRQRSSKLKNCKAMSGSCARELFNTSQVELTNHVSWLDRWLDGEDSAERYVAQDYVKRRLVSCLRSNP